MPRSAAAIIDRDPGCVDRGAGRLIGTAEAIRLDDSTGPRSERDDESERGMEMAGVRDRVIMDREFGDRQSMIGLAAGRQRSCLGIAAA